ncbi:hypothetical protein D9756_000240 [Leucocoprinus leucothites]|uniref:Uncharacterized protein n=1 Tax=Leucocoprinus leucothites TaxID=201217 RepID=A0A8H5GED8_9AGAR|nr:hypothetical protein D9756_000240 [Leucoagaricus leucothites]
MGKWTPNYTDNVLNSKISALITGAINRAAVEKEATITYDDFVNELDTGDAFTTSLIDILVKELAERHTRPFQNDERRLIAPCTAERLISLANPRQIYRGERPGNRNHAGRRTYNLAEFMNIPSTEIDMDEEENDFGNFWDAATGSAEGARFNADIFDGYGSHGWPSISRRLGTTPSPPIEDEPLWRPHGPLSSTGRSTTWAAIPTSGNTSSNSLARHPSIRRPTRRMVDFNDWTSRRRSAIRDTVGSHGEGPESNPSFSLGTGGESSQTVRRFFPTVPRRAGRVPESRTEDRQRDDEGRVYPLGVSMEREWSPSLIMRGADPHSSPGSNSTMSGDRPLPRLRRGGVRPPETVYNRYSWSAPTASSRPTESQSANGDSSSARSPSLSPAEPLRPLSPQAREDVAAASSEPVGYPTPGSIDNEPASV